MNIKGLMSQMLKQQRDFGQISGAKKFNREAG